MHSDLLSLKVHVDGAGKVWYANASGPPVCTNKSVSSFLLNPICAEMPRFRLMSAHSNAQLILALYARRLKTDIGAIEVCSPLVCGTAAERDNPEHVLYALREFKRVASLGGWHTFGKLEFPAYALASHLQKVGLPDDHAYRLLKTHVAWPALSFIPQLDMNACCRLFADILDPRRFLDPKHPVRGSKLRKYLGLDLKTLAGAIGRGPKQKYNDRCQLVFGAVLNTIKSESRHPSYFLNHKLQKDSDKRGTEVAVLRMLQTFVEYVRLTWLAGLGAGKHQAEALFAPEHFFEDEFEIAAWRYHMKKQLEAV